MPIIQAMPDVPAICDNCGAVFPSGLFVEDVRNLWMSGNKAGPCPSCGAMGSIPDGLYDTVGDSLRIVTSWAPEDRDRFATTLADAQQAGDRDAAAEAISTAPGLAEVAARIVPRDAAQFWAFIACLLTLLQMLGVGRSEPSVNINETRVVERVMERLAPTVPEPQRPAHGQEHRLQHPDSP